MLSVEFIRWSDGIIQNRLPGKTIKQLRSELPLTHNPATEPGIQNLYNKLPYSFLIDPNENTTSSVPGTALRPEFNKQSRTYRDIIKYLQDRNRLEKKNTDMILRQYKAYFLDLLNTDIKNFLVNNSSVYGFSDEYRGPNGNNSNRPSMFSSVIGCVGRFCSRMGRYPIGKCPTCDKLFYNVMVYEEHQEEEHGNTFTTGIPPMLKVGGTRRRRKSQKTKKQRKTIRKQ